MKRVISLSLSILMMLISVSPCIALNVEEDDVLVCLTEDYAEKEEYITNLLTRMMEINLELKKTNSVDNIDGYAAQANLDTDALLDEYEQLSDSLSQYQMTFNEFESIVYPSINAQTSLLSDDEYELSDVTNAFDMLTGMYNIVTLPGSWVRGGSTYDTFCVMVTDKVGGTNLDTLPQNVTLYGKKSQNNTLENFVSWIFELGTNYVTREKAWYVDSIFSFFNMNGGFDISEVNHAYQLTVSGTATMRYTYVKPKDGTKWTHANTSQKVIVTETHLTHYKVYPEGGQSYYTSDTKDIRVYLDGRYYMSDFDAIDNYRSYNNPSALFVTQNNIEATYKGKDNDLTIKFTYYDYPFQLH